MFAAQIPIAPAPPHARLTQVLDFAERAIVAAVYLGLAARLVAQGWFNGEVANLLLLPSEGLVVVFLLLRRRTHNISLRCQDWLLAMAATLAPMLVAPATESAALVPPVLAAGLMLMGLIIQVHAKIALGRSFGCVPAHRGLQLSGPYSFVRHPMYAGYLMSHVAFLLVNPTLRNTLAYVACYALQIPRLIAEERMLAFDPKYREYLKNVKSRLIPGVF